MNIQLRHLLWNLPAKLGAALLVLALSLLLGGCKQKAFQSPEELANHALAAIRQDNPEAYRQAMPQKPAGWRQVGAVLMRTDSLSPRQWRRYQRRLHHYPQGLESRFEKLRRWAAREDIPLEDIQFEKAEYTLDRHGQRLKVPNLVLHFRAGEKTCRLRLREAVQLERGWVLADLPSGYIHVEQQDRHTASR